MLECRSHTLFFGGCDASIAKRAGVECTGDWWVLCCHARMGLCRRAGSQAHEFARLCHRTFGAEERQRDRALLSSRHQRFKFKDEGLPPGTPMPTSEHPVQSFQWGDYTAKAATTYRFKVTPVYGKPKLLELDEASSTTVEITTEAEEGATAPHDGAGHNIYFNRGAAGSQAFARKFPGVELDENKPQSDPMVWLSRGLFEALTNFIRRAAQDDASDYKLRAMLYEFRYLPVGQAFKEAADAGADVDIRYEAQSYKDDNEAMIKNARIKGLCTPQKSRGGIRHNKFIVLIHKDKPIAVWTGSTNISAGGIFGHSNVGHESWN